MGARSEARTLKGLRGHSVFTASITLGKAGVIAEGARATPLSLEADTRLDFRERDTESWAWFGRGGKRGGKGGSGGGGGGGGGEEARERVMEWYRVRY